MHKVKWAITGGRKGEKEFKEEKEAIAFCSRLVKEQETIGYFFDMLPTVESDKSKPVVKRKKAKTNGSKKK